MAARIEVEKVKEGEFRVRLGEAKSQSTHRVTLSQGDYRRLSDGKIEAQELIKLSFEFLLAREPKESISLMPPAASTPGSAAAAVSTRSTRR